MKTHSGFTLLEVLLVLCIISVGATAVVMTSGLANSEAKQATYTARQFSETLAFAVDSAIIEGQPMGIRLHSEGWETLVLNGSSEENDGWQELPHTGRVRYRGNWGTLFYSPSDATAKTVSPQVVVLPDGQFTPFALTLVSSKTQQRILSLSSSGTLPLHIQPHGGKQQ